ncbi:hypothetical protein [Photobacterium alginatilyticum]|uniref:Sporulation protein YjcZ n=1 Tax=Photobacterium alginatilyticum TaxID=1775171 RepID=A0ABW9YPJ2_9GAMM|nr:hypothetical protein [Photobacterium alginatilyticum]NBI55457.1 hypothetical protein [Photobacterium alginatilyticum]
MMGIPGITNSGSMPINAGGGAAGPSGVKANNESGFRVGDINMGGGSSNLLLLLVVVLVGMWFLMGKGG